MEQPAFAQEDSEIERGAPFVLFFQVSQQKGPNRFAANGSREKWLDVACQDAQLSLGELRSLHTVSTEAVRASLNSDFLARYAEWAEVDVALVVRG